MENITAYDRRKRIEREDGSVLSYTIPAGVTDEAAAEEVARCLRAVERGYSQKLGFHDGFRIDARWLVKQPRWLRWLALRAQSASRHRRHIDNVAFWLKCRWLDAYWFIKDTLQPKAREE